jgi:hypothetical protein
MKKLCPVCNTHNEAIGFNLTEKEIHNLQQIGLSEHLCKTCYQKELTSRLESTKSELIPLNKEKEITQAAYYKAYESWKAAANLYQSIDYNINIMKHVVKMKEKPVKIPKTSEPVNIELLCKQILESLSKEAQESIIQKFKVLQTDCQLNFHVDQ